jgi:hypothetical protein
MNEGDVVVVSTGQVGTLFHFSQSIAFVILRNGEIWTGNPGMVRKPQDCEIEQAPVEVERFEAREKRRNKSLR